MVYRCMCRKHKARSFTHQLESVVLYCHGLLKSSEAVHYCHSSILSEFCDRGLTSFEVGYRRLIDLTLPVHSDRSKSDHLDKMMLILALLDSSDVFFMLAMIGIVDCMLPIIVMQPLPHSIFCAWNGHFTSVWTGRNEMETSPFLTLKQPH